MRTGMEPFFKFLEAIRYAFQQSRIEYSVWQSYRRSMPQGNAESEPVLTGERRFIPKRFYGNPTST